MKLTSSAIKDGMIEKRYGNLGPEDNMAYGIPQTQFPLAWSEVPEGTESFALVFIDYDDVVDEGVPFIHWLACDIPGDCRELPENASREGANFRQGHNSWCMPFEDYREIPEDYSLHFGGPAPGYKHEYELWLYALDCKLELQEGFWYNELRRAMKGHILEETLLSGYYGEERK